MIGGLFKIASSAGLLPAIGWAVLGTAIVSGVTIGWGMHRWDKGAEALKENKTLQKDIADLNTAAKNLQQHAVDDAVAYKLAADRMNGIALALENQNAANESFFRTQSRSLVTLLRVRPDLSVAHLGPDVLQHWNESNQGSSIATPAAASSPAGKPANTVPGAPAGSKRPPKRSDGKPRPGGGAVSQLRQHHGGVAIERGRVAGDRVGLVLQSGRCGGCRRQRMRPANQNQRRWDASA